MKALITGASSGIGQALAHLLATKNFALIVSGRDEKRLKALCVPYYVADLSEKTGREVLGEVIEREVPDLLINCAGYGLYGEMVNTSVEEQITLLEVNAVAPIELTLLAAKAMVAAEKKGVILNVSSLAGELPAPGMGLYGPAKACLTHFSQSLSAELSPRGVHVLVCCPGMVASAFASRSAGKNIKEPKTLVMSPEYVAEQIWKQITTKQEKRIINWRYKVAAFFATHFLPTSFVNKIIWKRIRKRL